MIETELTERRPRTIHAPTAGIREQLIADGRLVPREKIESYMTPLRAQANVPVLRIGRILPVKWNTFAEAAEGWDQDQ